MRMQWAETSRGTTYRETELHEDNAKTQSFFLFFVGKDDTIWLFNIAMENHHF